MRVTLYKVKWTSCLKSPAQTNEQECFFLFPELEKASLQSDDFVVIKVIGFYK